MPLCGTPPNFRSARRSLASSSRRQGQLNAFARPSLELQSRLQRGCSKTLCVSKLKCVATIWHPLMSSSHLDILAVVQNKALRIEIDYYWFTLMLRLRADIGVPTRTVVPAVLHKDYTGIRHLPSPLQPLYVGLPYSQSKHEGLKRPPGHRHRTRYSWVLLG